MIICITGIDGCGKTTQAHNLIGYLMVQGHKAYLSKAYANEEKDIFEKLLPSLHQKAILFLFQALHVQQLQKAKKAITDGKIVVADRWDDSYLVYHSKNGILSTKPKLRNRLNELAFEGVKADLTFFLDVNIEVIMQRLKDRGESFFEKKPVKFFKEMRKSYLRLSKKENWIVIDGNISINEVSQIIINHVNNLLR